jgi:hypothetical protein
MCSRIARRRTPTASMIVGRCVTAKTAAFEGDEVAAERRR